MDNEKLLEILKSNSDESYASFSTMLSNTSLKIIGVKIPKLKELAKIYKDEDFSNITKNEYLEVDIFLGFVNKYKYNVYKERLLNLEYLFMKDSSWAVTDSVIAFNKKKDDETNIYFFKKWILSPYIFIKRMGYVLFIATLKDNKEALNILLNNSKETGIYYIDMAISWALAVASINFENEIYEYLKTTNDLFIKKQTIRKIKDSYRNTIEFKNKLNNLKGAKK